MKFCFCLWKISEQFWLVASRVRQTDWPTCRRHTWPFCCRSGTVASRGSSGIFLFLPWAEELCWQPGSASIWLVEVLRWTRASICSCSKSSVILAWVGSLLRSRAHHWGGGQASASPAPWSDRSASAGHWFSNLPFCVTLFLPLLYSVLIKQLLT